MNTEEREALADATEDLIFRAHGITSSYRYQDDDPFVEAVGALLAARDAEWVARIEALAEAWADDWGLPSSKWSEAMRQQRQDAESLRALLAAERAGGEG